MLKSIGYIGYGFVGKACHESFKHNATAIIVDPKYSTTTITEMVAENPELIFVSINAPTLDDRTVDCSLIYSIFKQLADLAYNGIVVLKSTVPPDTAHDLYEKFGNWLALGKVGPLRYVYSPEFLREATWQHDANHPQMIILAGDGNDCNELENIYKRHSHVKCEKYAIMDYKEAALAKYTINSFLASKVVFMNQIYRVYSDVYGQYPDDAVWDYFTHVISQDTRFGDSHLKVPGHEGALGYGGNCFPKDVKAFIGFDKHNRLSVLTEVEQANTKLRIS